MTGEKRKSLLRSFFDDKVFACCAIVSVLGVSSLVWIAISAFVSFIVLPIIRLFVALITLGLAPSEMTFDEKLTTFLDMLKFPFNPYTLLIIAGVLFLIMLIAYFTPVYVDESSSDETDDLSSDDSDISVSNNTGDSSIDTTDTLVSNKIDDSLIDTTDTLASNNIDDSVIDTTDTLASNNIDDSPINTTYMLTGNNISNKKRKSLLDIFRKHKDNVGWIIAIAVGFLVVEWLVLSVLVALFGTFVVVVFGGALSTLLGSPLTLGETRATIIESMRDILFLMLKVPFSFPGLLVALLFVLIVVIVWFFLYRTDDSSDEE